MNSKHIGAANLAAAELAAKKEAKKKYAAERRRVLRYFNSPKTQDVMRNVIRHTSSALTSADIGRIIQCFKKRLDDYLVVNDAEMFRTMAATRVKRLAKITERLTSILPNLCLGDYDLTARSVLWNVNDYQGSEDDVDAVTDWATVSLARSTAGLAAFYTWRRQHRKAVYRGLWDTLQGCLDLGVGDIDPSHPNPVIEELASEVWLWTLKNASRLLEPEVPVHKRLRGRARFVARAWKTKRLRERERFVNIDQECKAIDAIEKARLSGKLPQRRIVLGPGDIDERPTSKVRLRKPLKKKGAPLWTEADLAAALRRAGPFRAHDDAN